MRIVTYLGVTYYTKEKILFAAGYLHFIDDLDEQRLIKVDDIKSISLSTY